MIGEGGKSPKNGSLASDFRLLFTMGKRRWTKLFAYGFVVAFVGCTVFLAFNPSGDGSPWFNSLFTSSSFSSSIAPYRSHFNNLISRFFPNSTVPSSIDEDNPFVSRDVGAQRDGISPNGAPRSDDSANGSAKNGIVRRNQTEGELRLKKGGSVEKNSTEDSTGIQKNEASLLNLTTEGAKPKKDGVFPKKNEDRVPAKNQTEIILRPAKNGVTETKNLGNEAALKGDGVAPTVQKEGNSAVATPAAVQSRNQTTSSAIVQSRDQTTAVAGAQLKNRTTPSASARPKNQTKTLSGNSTSSEKNGAPASKEMLSGGSASNMSASLTKGNTLAAHTSNGAEKKTEDWIKGMLSCDIFHGRWVKDDSYPLYAQGSCPYIDEPFDCYLNGRPDRAYQKLRWQPDGCKIPRFNALDLLERLRGKRLVFVGDSLNRNMWESLVCVLRNSVKDKKKVLEASGRHEFRTEGSYSFLFKDYNCTVEFFRSPFLVQEWEMPDSNGKKKETLRLDIIERSSSRYKDAHVIVFNTGHWWTHEKTAKGRDYYQEGNRVYSELNVVEAFHKALHTWAKWVDANVNSKKTLVFFRGYSASHFRGGQWNSGGACDRETEPIKNDKYLSPYPPKMRVLETVLSGMKTPVSYLNITRMTDFRKDAHPSIYRKQNLTEEERRDPERFQDCSHWCLPGVPDTWNELLYAHILIKQHQTPSW